MSSIFFKQWRWTHWCDVISSLWIYVSACVCVCVQGDFRHKSSFVIWGRRGRCGPPRWVKAVTCGTALRAVWPRSCYTSRSELWALTTNSNTPVCQRRQDSRITFQDHSCRTEIHAFNLISQYRNAFAHIHRCYLVCFACLEVRQKKMKHYCVRKKGMTFLQTPPACHLTTPFSPFNFKPSAIWKKKKKHFLHCLKYVRLFLMEYILKSL